MNPANSPRPLVVVLMSAVLVLFSGCAALRDPGLSRREEVRPDVQTEAAREREAARQADRMGEKPQPTNYSRN